MTFSVYLFLLIIMSYMYRLDICINTQLYCLGIYIDIGNILKHTYKYLIYIHICEFRT